MARCESPSPLSVELSRNCEFPLLLFLPPRGPCSLSTPRELQPLHFFRVRKTPCFSELCSLRITPSFPLQFFVSEPPLSFMRSSAIGLGIDASFRRPTLGPSFFNSHQAFGRDHFPLFRLQVSGSSLLLSRQSTAITVGKQAAFFLQ